MANFWKSSFAFAFLFAHEYSSADELNTRLSSLEARMNAIRTETPKGTVGAQLANAAPLFDGYGLFVTADLLFWHLYEGGTDYALSRESTGSFPTISGKSSRMHFDWDFGFRVGGGYHFEHDAWDAYVNFTWFQTKAVDHAHRSSDETLVPQKGSVNTTNATKIKGHWHVHNYVIDLESGRRFFVSKYLAFRPQLGVETAWIFQRRRFNTKQPLDTTTQIEGSVVRGRCNFWGIGPRAGLEGNWFFDRHFSLFGNVNAALLWGRFDTKQKEKKVTPSGNILSFSTKDDFHRLVPNVQMATGVSWDGNLAEDRYHLSIRLSYEFQYWWRQNQFLNEQATSIYGLQHESFDMTLNGATLDICFDF